MEVVPAPWTDIDVVNKTMDIMKEVGQVPVLVKKEINGFVLNRIQYAILGETYRLIEVFTKKGSFGLDVFCLDCKYSEVYISSCLQTAYFTVLGPSVCNDPM